MEVLKKGTVEPLLVSLRDRLENITTLASVSGLVFDTKRKSNGSAVESNVAATYEELTAICPITTTNAGYVIGEEYKLYLRFTIGADSPVLGPIFFRVEDD